MDKEFLVGVTGAVTAFLGLVAAIIIGILISQQQQIQFTQICVDSHRNVVYAEVNGLLVSECK